MENLKVRFTDHGGFEVVSFVFGMNNDSDKPFYCYQDRKFIVIGSDGTVQEVKLSDCELAMNLDVGLMDEIGPKHGTGSETVDEPPKPKTALQKLAENPPDERGKPPIKKKKLGQRKTQRKNPITEQAIKHGMKPVKKR